MIKLIAQCLDTYKYDYIAYLLFYQTYVKYSSFVVSTVFDLEVENFPAIQQYPHFFEDFFFFVGGSSVYESSSR